MPLLIDTESRTGALVAAVNHLLAEGGPRALSLRAVARTSAVSSSSIIHHLGSMEHLMRVSAHWTGLARATSSSCGGGLRVLPRTCPTSLTTSSTRGCGWRGASCGAPSPVWS